MSQNSWNRFRSPRRASTCRRSCETRRCTASYIPCRRKRCRELPRKPSPRRSSGGVLLRALSSVLVHAALRKHDLQHQQHGSSDDTTIGHIEVRPDVTADVKVQEVRHLAADDPVPEVSDRAAKNERQADSRCGQRMIALPEKISNNPEREAREADEQSGAPLRRGIGEESERRPPIVYVRDLEKSRNDCDCIVRRQSALNYDLGDAVEQNRCHRDGHMHPA